MSLWCCMLLLLMHIVLCTLDLHSEQYRVPFGSKIQNMLLTCKIKKQIPFTDFLTLLFFTHFVVAFVVVLAGVQLTS